MASVKNKEVREVTIPRKREPPASSRAASGPSTSRISTSCWGCRSWADSGLLGQLTDSRVTIKGGEGGAPSPLFAIFITWGPILLIAGLWIFFMRQFQAGGNKALSFGKSRAKLLNMGGKRVTFADVAGYEGVKVEITEVVDFLKHPEKFGQKLGAHIPKGILLVSHPARARRSSPGPWPAEAIFFFSSISGSDFMEMFVGVGASQVRDLFQTAKKMGRAIIFIDEIDSIGRKRGAGLGGGHDERERTLNQMLNEMDGFEATEGIVRMMAATNRPDILDPALLRPGRFDRQVIVGPLPEMSERLAILGVHTKGRAHQPRARPGKHRGGARPA